MAEVVFDRLKAQKILEPMVGGDIGWQHRALDALATCYSIADAPKPLPAGTRVMIDTGGMGEEHGVILRAEAGRYLLELDGENAGRRWVAAGYVEEIK